MEALVRRRTKTAETGHTHPVDMEALVRRPAKPVPPAPAVDMEALVKRAVDKPPAETEDPFKVMRARDAERAAKHPVGAPDMAALLRRPPSAPPPPPVDWGALLRPPSRAETPAPTKTDQRRQQADALVARAREIEPALVEGMRFNTRLHRFLDLRPTAWTTWGEDEARVIVQAASAQAEATRQLSLANAVKWSAECEQAYSRPPGFFDRFAQNAKPEFYRVRLEQARDILTKAQDDLQAIQTRLAENLGRLRIDALVLQVATEHETDPSNQITATRRLQTLVQVQATGAMIVQGCETAAQTCAGQAATVSSLLTVTIPNWIMALQNR